MPTARERIALWGRTVFRVLGQNRLSQAGVVVTTATGISMVFLWVIETIQGVAFAPKGFGRVTDIVAESGGIALRDESGRKIQAAVDLSFLGAKR